MPTRSVKISSENVFKIHRIAKFSMLHITKFFRGTMPPDPPSLSERGIQPCRLRAFQGVNRTVYSTSNKHACKLLSLLIRACAQPPPPKPVPSQPVYALLSYSSTHFIACIPMASGWLADSHWQTKLSGPSQCPRNYFLPDKIDSKNPLLEDCSSIKALSLFIVGPTTSSIQTLVRGI
jgi:hypothetical protein